MEANTYSISSLQDIANAVTPENLDNFIEDFKGVLSAYLTLITMAKAKMESEPDDLKNTDIVKFRGLYWTDDGKHDIICKITKK